MNERHVSFMRRALALAARGRGTTRPNPMVGCVLVKHDAIVAEGWHRRAGGPHAEVEALRKAGSAAHGATAYVTLEPCNHEGRTGPCTEALIAAGVARVIFAMSDPNPHVVGRGRARLFEAGIEVEAGMLEAEALELNHAWDKWIRTGRPWVTLKGAVSLDGRLATSSGESKWITGEAARKEAHRLRAAHDAILVGAGTVLADDPSLTVRDVKGSDPRRLILDGALKISPDAKAVPGSIIFTTQESGHAPFLARGAEVVVLPGERIAMTALLEAIGAHQLRSVLVEGGGQVHGALLREGLVDEVHVFVAPLLIGGDGVPLLAGPGAATMDAARRLSGPTIKKLGDDVHISGRLR
ncbi:MAG: bifunctional diaminohydroxyphosphoribosylaminopyrimidine deaminase/5-amino-6-(5-phosphoribosylamino)uracil reductase RibD [Polyangia bacterium]